MGGEREKEREVGCRLKWSIFSTKFTNLYKDHPRNTRQCMYMYMYIYMYMYMYMYYIMVLHMYNHFTCVATIF